MPKIHFLNVNQGDCILLEHNLERLTIFDISAGNIERARRGQWMLQQEDAVVSHKEIQVQRDALGARRTFMSSDTGRRILLLVKLLSQLDLAFPEHWLVGLALGLPALSPVGGHGNSETRRQSRVKMCCSWNESSYDILTATGTEPGPEELMLNIVCYSMSYRNARGLG